MGMEFGLLLPHFGEYGDRDRLILGARSAEREGFDSVFVRDHMMFEPHGEFEKPDNTFFEAFTVLTAIGASTERLKLGTGSLIPFRHPIHTALITATISNLFPGRLIIGMGSGNSDRQFEQVGLGGIDRPDLVRSNANILRRLWAENDVDYTDDHYAFTDVTIEPKPKIDVPFWYCGNTPKSARLAVEFAEGWLPGRIGIETLRKRVESLEEGAAEVGKPRPTVGIIPSASVEATREEALATVNVDGLLTWANNAKFWVKPASGRFETVEDLSGVLLAGTPEQVAEQAVELYRAGVEHLVFDTRLKYDRWYEQIEMLGREVLPLVRAEIGEG